MQIVANILSSFFVSPVFFNSVMECDIEKIEWKSAFWKFPIKTKFF